MQKQRYKDIKHFSVAVFLVFLLIVFLAPQFCFSKVDLEIEFPAFGGEKLSGDSSLPKLISYVFNVIVVAALISILLSLIYGGFMYLSSAGQPTKMADARKRLFGSGLGLMIVLIAFLTLKIVNPDFLVLKIKKAPIETGVLFLNETAFNDGDVVKDLKSVNSEVRNAIIDTLLNNATFNSSGKLNPRAVYMAWSEPDLRTKFGSFEIDVQSKIVGSAGGDDIRLKYLPSWEDSEDTTKKFNFEDFKLYGLFFLPDANVKVSTYYYDGFNELDSASASILGVGGGFFEGAKNEYTYPACSALSGGPCKFKMFDGEFIGGTAFPAAYKESAPLSVKMEHFGKGVFLRSEKSIYELSVLNYGNELSDLNSFNFDDKTKEIEIRNWDFEHYQDEGDPKSPNDDIDELRGIKQKNYLVALYDDAFFKGKFRMFFEKFQRLDVMLGMKSGNLPTPGPLNESGVESLTIDAGDVDPNNPEPAKTEVKNEPDSYGRVEGVSSVRIFEMPQTDAEIQKWQRYGCKIKLCATPAKGSRPADFTPAKGSRPADFHDCLIYDFSEYGIGYDRENDPDGKSSVRMFLPFNIPDDKRQAVNGLGETEKNIDGSDKDKVVFQRNIVSMQIEGDCAVALFEHSVDEYMCEECVRTEESVCDGCWESNSPGKHSEFFGPGDGEYSNYKDLTSKNLSHQIARCGFTGGWLNRTTEKCASSLIVFPIKR